ncbi:MAG TPA: glycosyltransferase family 39 protein [Candidatus Gastranaerophilaceae bacterium]|nr:glycosyltransferase family 39 protein [Candidatus Gastranaerophilaceae bacterium]
MLWILLGVGIFLTYAHHGHLIIDCGREVYYPTQILEGKLLYKDLFNIYGPFSYLFNAVLFKLFGINLNVLYLAGCFCAFLITTLIYKIARKFLTEIISFSIAFFTICTGVLNTNLFNFIFPYSYAMLYGMVAFLISFLFLAKYIQEPHKVLNLYLSGFFAGFCIANKYEFLPYLLVFLYMVLKIEKVSFKTILLLLLSILSIPLVCFSILFLQGMGINDLVLAFETVKKMAQSQTLKYFYTTQGVVLDKKTLGYLALNFAKTVTPILLMTWSFMMSKKWLSVLLIIFATASGMIFMSPASLTFLPVLILGLFILHFRKYKNEKIVLILALSAILISLKSFWGLATLNYGVFFAGFLIVAIFALIENKFYQKAIFVYIILLSLVLGFQNLSELKDKSYCIQTSRGKICSQKYLTKSSEDLINFIDKNTKKTDSMVILPEGLVINFLMERKSDDYYNSLIPLYWEVFGDEKLIEYFEKTKPDYIVFSNWDNKDYYFRYICSDYAVSFCNYVAKNYRQEKIIDNGFRYLIYRKK